MIELLRTVPLFASLKTREINFLSEIVKEVEYPANTVLFYEGDLGDSLYIVIDGQLEVVKALGKPEEHPLRVVTIFQPGACYKAAKFVRSSLESVVEIDDEIERMQGDTFYSVEKGAGEYNRERRSEMKTEGFQEVLEKIRECDCTEAMKIARAALRQAGELLEDAIGGLSPEQRELLLDQTYLRF